MDDFYHPENRRWQEKFNSRALADRLKSITLHDELTDRDRAFIETRDMFFISTVDDEGRPTVSYKGGDPGFVKVVDSRTLAFPNYDGNGMFLTAGNIDRRADVGLLFIDFENPIRLRIHGSATVSTQDPLASDYPEALFITRIEIRNIFVNCGRYIHKYKKLASSDFLPRENQTTPQPDWKRDPHFSDVVPDLEHDE